MSQMYYVPHAYPYPYYSNGHTFDTRSNNEPIFHPQVVSESLLERIKEEIFDNFAIVIPAGKWQNLTNTGEVLLKLYSIYAPPPHPFGTVHETKAEAMAAEHNPLNW